MFFALEKLKKILREELSQPTWLMRESSYPIGTMDYQAREEKNHFMSIA
jgi:hypothetical protein